MRSLCFFLFCALYEQEVSEINIKMVSQSRTPLTPSPSTTSIISEALGVSRKSDSWEVWGVEDNTGFSDQKVQQVKKQKVLFISDERVEHKYLKSISRWFPRAGHHWRLLHQQQALFQRHLVWAERVTHEKCEGSRIIQVSVIKRCNRSKHKRCSSFQMKE